MGDPVTQRWSRLTYESIVNFITGETRYSSELSIYGHTDSYKFHDAGRGHRFETEIIRSHFKLLL